MRQEALIFREFINEALDCSTHLFNRISIHDRMLTGMAATEHVVFESYHSVLSHQNDTLSSKTLANLVHLLRANIVDCDDED